MTTETIPGSDEVAPSIPPSTILLVGCSLLQLEVHIVVLDELGDRRIVVYFPPIVLGAYGASALVQLRPPASSVSSVSLDWPGINATPLMALMRLPVTV